MSIVSDSSRLAPTAVVHPLLDGIVDYAGLFPPAGQTMMAAMLHYAAHQRGPCAWMLGRFVLPIERWSEFQSVRAAWREDDRRIWNVSLVVGRATPAQFEPVADDMARDPTLRVTAIEAKADIVEVCRFADHLPGHPDIWVEGTADSLAWFNDLAAHHAGGKIRLGGVAAGAFPAAESVIEFMRGCRAAGVPFKATAGLHHPIGGLYPLTYDADSARARMYGFLNLLTAALLLRHGAPAADAVAALTGADPDEFGFTAEALRWRDTEFSVAQIAAGRRFLRSFGSCSFAEPVEGLEQMQWV